MEEHNTIFVGLDVSKDRHAVAVAEGGRDGIVRYFGEIGSDDVSVRRLVKKLARPDVKLHFCYEAGPTGYGLQRLIETLGHSCAVIAPSLIPNRPGDRVKTNRRDAERLARLLRAGELTESRPRIRPMKPCANSCVCGNPPYVTGPGSGRRSVLFCCVTGGPTPAARPGGRNTSIGLPTRAFRSLRITWCCRS